MAFEFNLVSIDNIDKNGNQLLPQISFDTTTTPVTSIKQFAIGNRVRMTFEITATGADNFTNKAMTINLGLFQTATDTNAPHSGIYGFFGYTSIGNLTTVPSAGVISNSNSIYNETVENISCVFYKDVSDVIAYAEIDFYVSIDILRFYDSTFILNNTDRFLVSRDGNQGTNQLTNINSSVYNQDKFLGVVGRVMNFTTSFDQDIINPNDLSRFWNIPVSARWYNSQYYSPTGGMRYIRDLEITSPSQVTNSLPTLTKATATGSQLQNNSVDSAFNVLRNQLAINENNTVKVNLRGLSNLLPPNPAITDVRVVMFKTIKNSNLDIFTTDLEVSDALIPQGAVGSVNIDNMIWTPSDWYENVPNPDDIYVEFTINGSQLTLNDEYRFIVNIYDSANALEVTSHISPNLIASYTAPIVPNIDGYLSTYNAEFSGNDLTVSPHQRIKASIEIDKTSYNTQLIALGLPGTFDSCLTGITCNFVGIGSIVNQVQAYIPNTLTPPLTNQLLTDDMSVTIDNATTLRVEAIFRISEAYAGNTSYFDWSISVNQPQNISGVIESNIITYRQKINVDLFNNDQISPNLLAVRFLDPDLYPTVKNDIIDLCGRDKILVEIEKDSAYTGSINLIATIYPASASGQTTPPQIEEEESWIPFTQQMNLLISDKLQNVETGFLGDDFATFEIFVPQLPFADQYFITGIAFNTTPDYCPVGLVQNTKISAYYGASKWRIECDLGLLITEITSHPNYTGNINVIRYRIVDQNGVLVGATQTISGNILSVLRISGSLSTVYFQLIIDADFDFGFGSHTVRHTLDVTVLKPVVPVPAIVPFDSNSYICSDLG